MRVRSAAPLWSLLGVAALFVFAIIRLGSRGLTTIADGLSAAQWVVLGVTVAVFVYGEGVMALQRRWVPRLVRRARALGRGSSPWLQALGPFYGMSLVGASRPDMLRAWGGVLTVIAAVLLVGRLPEPWRGIVDLAVASALVWGVVAIARSLSGVMAAEPRSERDRDGGSVEVAARR